MTKPIYAKVPLDADLTNSYYLTAGKTYKAKSGIYRGFEIVANSGNVIYCLPEYCDHLNNGSWELIYD